MPTRKEVSKIRADFIEQREKLIRSRISDKQLELFDLLVNKYLSKPLDKASTQSIINQIQKAVESFASETNTSILKQYSSSATSLADLNLMYFSTMIDNQQRLNEIKDKNIEILNKRLGLNDDGSLKRNGFIDKMIADDSIQKAVIKQVKLAASSGADPLTLKNNLKKIIVGAPGGVGVFEKHYNTFAKDILNRIDNANNRIYAQELGLKHAYYSGGLIITSRSFCIKNNGKIFSEDQIKEFKNDPFIKDMYGKNISEYDPFELPGGYGCLHTLDWITSDLAKGKTREQNKLATERNKRFKERNNL